MADMILRFKVMPVDSEVDYDILLNDCKAELDIDEVKEIREAVLSEVGFGLKAVEIEIRVDEKFGCDFFEEKLKEVEDAEEASVIKMDRL